MATEERRPRSKSIANQLQDALLDAAALQSADKKTRAEESYISQCKLVSTRISALQKLLSLKEQSTVEDLRKELKQELAALKLEIEALQKSAVPAAPAVDPVARKVYEDSLKFSQTVTEVKVEPVVTVVTPAPGKGDSVDGDLLRRNLARVPLTPPTPPRVESLPQLPNVLAQPRPVIPASEVEKKSIAAMGSQFQNTESNVARLQREGRQNAAANKSIVERIAEGTIKP